MRASSHTRVRLTASPAEQRAVVLRALRADGLLLQHACETLRGDREVPPLAYLFSFRLLRR